MKHLIMFGKKSFMKIPISNCEQTFDTKHQLTNQENGFKKCSAGGSSFISALRCYKRKCNPAPPIRMILIAFFN